MSDLTRQTLLMRLQKGGSDADWEEFKHFYWGLITSWARMFGCSETLAEDIFQNTVLSLLRNLPNFKHSGEPGSFRKWLKTIVQCRVRDHIRWEMKHSEKTSAEEDPDKWKLGSKHGADQADPTGEQEASMDRIWLNHIMESALEAARKRVKPEKFESFRRYVIYQEPVEKVSQDMGIRQGTIFQHKSSFLDILRDEFIRHLEGLHDLGPEMSDDSVARKRLKNALESYISSRKELRDTMVVQEPPAVAFEKVNVLQKVLDQNPAPAPGDWLLTISERGADWHRLEPETIIGSSDDCTVRLDGSGVSATHARVTTAEDGWVAKDEGSTNGLWRNGRRIGEWALHPGDCLQIADHCIFYVNDEISGGVQ